MTSRNRVLSIQSHVVSGYVGNKCATFPLQLLGFDVDPLNTVLFSNHTGYRTVKGEKLSAPAMQQLLDGLEENQLLEYSHVLTGYNGNADSLHIIAQAVQDIRAHHPALLYVCDPVMGDGGVLYVPQEVIPIYRDVLLPLADVITPNQYEAELLTQRTLHTTADAQSIMTQLHALGPRYVIISSAELRDANPDKLYLLGSCQLDQLDEPAQFRIEMDKLNGSFTGTGDLFAALLLARLTQATSAGTASDAPVSPLALACQRTLGTMVEVLRHTMSYQKAIPADAPKRGDSAIARTCELRLIECRDHILSPSISLPIEPLTTAP